MVSLAAKLSDLLKTVQRVGDFYSSGTCDIPIPGLEVEGVGPVALPLLPEQARALVAVAEAAPYGRGEQTLVDTQVRRTWQIDARRVHLRSRAWAKTLDEIVKRAAGGLGVTEPVTADLYKLLVYDQGSFFVSHRDTEKTRGMFATLVVVLPSAYTGGELVIHHKSRKAQIDLRSAEPTQAAFAAFYADCQHEVLPVTSGCRLTLIYNLSRKKGGKQPDPPDYGPEQQRLAQLLRLWAEPPPDDGASLPDKLVYVLEHAYSQESLSFDALKGADSARASTLLAATRAADCELHLALLSIEESGAAEYTVPGSYYRRYGRYDDDDAEEDDEEFAAGEVEDSSESLTDWRRPDGLPSGLPALPMYSDETSPPAALDDLDPDEISFQEATGNAGVSFERSYRRAVLVLWPRRRQTAVINQGGLSATLPYLSALVGRWAEAEEDCSSPLWAEAHELSAHMLASWPMPQRFWRPALAVSSHAATMLELLTRLGDAECIDRFLVNVSCGGDYGIEDNESLLRAIRLLPPPVIVERITQIIAAAAGTAPGATSDLLARVSAAASTLQLPVSELRPAAVALVAALPRSHARAAPVDPFDFRMAPMEPATVVNALTALSRIDPALADAAMDTFLAWPKTYDPDAVLVPAALALASTATAGTVAQRLRNACMAHLHARIALPLAPPSDWARSSQLGCTCRHCRELARFLADPVRESWNFKAVQADRSHVETIIRSSQCDLDLTTLRRGSPHTLVCTKNQVSYERQARQRRKDLEDLGRIEGLR